MTPHKWEPKGGDKNGTPNNIEHDDGDILVVVCRLCSDWKWRFCVWFLVSRLGRHSDWISCTLVTLFYVLDYFEAVICLFYALDCKDICIYY